MAGGNGDGWMNRLIYGDNLLAMQALLAGDAQTGLPSLRGKVDLIYIDPPFDSKADYRTKISLPGANLEQRPTVVEQFAYADTWAEGTISYLQMMYVRLNLMKELLSDCGSIYLHIDWHVAHYVKLLLDELFGKNHFINEIIWSYKTGGVSKNFFAKKHDNIFFYSKTDKFSFNTQYYKSYQQKKYNYNANYPELWDEEKQQWYHNSVCRDVWEDINVIGTEKDGSERTSYATQKPKPSSNASSKPRLTKATSSATSSAAAVQRQQ